MKFIITLILALLVAFLSWPYYYLYRLDNALGHDDVIELVSLVDLEAIREHSQARLDRGIDRIGGQLSGGQAGADSVMGWLQQNLKDLTAAVVNDELSVEQVRDTLRSLARAHTDVSPPYFMAAVDFAFFESLDTFLIRLGKVDDDPAYVRLGFEHGRWVVTDIIP